MEFRYTYCSDNWTYKVYDFSLAPQVVSSYFEVRKYFRILFQSPVPSAYRKRKSSFDFADTAVITFARIDTAFHSNPIYAGSKFLGPHPWTIFGPCDSIPADIYLDTRKEFIEHYSCYTEGDCKKYPFYFRTTLDMLQKLAKKYEISANLLFNIAIILLHDCICFCGPDINEFYDLFTNDVREDPDSMDISDWEKLRCKFLGKHGEIDWQNYSSVIRKIDRSPRKRYRSQAEFKLLYSGNQL